MLTTLRLEQFGDVQRLRMASAGGRLARIDVSAYVVRGVLIDTGFHRVRRALHAAITAMGVRAVIVTHWHEDHAGNVTTLARRGLPIALRSETERALRTRPDIQFYRRAIWGHPPALDSHVVPFEPQGFQLVHTPGHSEDHQVVLDLETGTLFSGDLWLGIRARVFHSSEDPYAIIESLRRAAALRPERMFDAHRGLVGTPSSALVARADWLAETIDTITRRVADGWSDREILAKVLGGEERAAIVSRGDYARVNLVRAVRRRSEG
jgi:glyoxylase-like metal-dependent hydrolase (beta-lactamase superfamily II)